MAARGAWWVWGLAASFYLVALFHRMSLGVASLDAQSRFDLAPGTIATLSALQLGLYLLMTIPAGLAADRIGPRRALAIGLVLMAVGETTFGLATSAGPALAGRALVGVGDAFMFLSVLRLAQNWFPARRYALLAALTGLAGAIGQIGTTVPLGLSLDGAGWTATFVTSGVLTAPAGARLPARHPRPPGGRPSPRARRAARPRPDPAHAAGGLGAPGHAPRLLGALRADGPVRRDHRALGLPLPGPSRRTSRRPPRAPGCWSASPRSARPRRCSARSSPAPRARAPACCSAPRSPSPAGWAATLLWPGGHPPAAVILATLVVTGVGGACAMLAFDVARAGNPAAHRRRRDRPRQHRRLQRGGRRAAGGGRRSSARRRRASTSPCCRCSACWLVACVQDVRFAATAGAGRRWRRRGSP